MTEHEHSFKPSHVEETDLLALLSESITDPLHYQRWRDAAALEPVLLREVGVQAYQYSEHLRSDGPARPEEVVKWAMDMASYVIKSLNLAVERTNAVTDADNQRLPDDVNSVAQTPEQPLPS